MVLGRVERYTIEQGPEGLSISMRQVTPALGGAAVTGGALFAIWWFGPYGPHPLREFDGVFYWLVFGFLALFVVLGVVGSFYRERWIIADHEIRMTHSFGTVKRRVPKGPAVKMRLQAKRSSDSTDYRVHLLGEGGQELGVSLLFGRSTSVDELLRLVRPVLNLEIEDQRLEET